MKTIGMLIPTADNSFFSELVQNAERYLHEQGYRLMICSSDNQAEKEKEYYEVLLKAGVSGILSVSGLSELPDGLIPGNLPLVWLDRVPTSKRIIPWVANDDAEAMKLAAETLIRKGCKDIALLPGYLAEHRESPRVTGYRRALEENGISYRDEYVLNRTTKGSSESEAERMIRELLRKGNRVDGILASSDRAAFGAMAALRSVGCYVPEDVKLISFDNSSYSTMGTPSISALDRNPQALAETACEILLKEISGSTDYLVENCIPVTLKERDSIR